MFKNITTNLMVEDVIETVSFYEDKLGFTMINSVPNERSGLQFAIISKDDLILMIQEKTSLIEEYPILKTDKVQPSISLYIQVDNLEELYEKLKTTYSIYQEMHTTFYDATEFAIVDNNGYVLTFTKA